MANVKSTVPSKVSSSSSPVPHVPKDDKDGKDSKGVKTALVLSDVDSKIGRKVSLGPSSNVSDEKLRSKLLGVREVAALLGALGDSQPADPKHDDEQEPSIEAMEALLRQELLLARTVGSARAEANKIAESKHVYTVTNGAVTTAETTIPICRVVGGTASNTRTTNTIKLKHATVRTILRVATNGPGTVGGVDCGVTIVFWRDRIPTTPGTAPTIFGTDANPPASGTLMFSRLGSNDVTYNSLPVRNPITAMSYHIYEVHHKTITFDNFQYTTPATSLGIPSPQRFRLEHKFDLHDVVQDYAAYSSTAPDINDMYVTYILDTDLTNQNYSIGLYVNTDVEFEDVQV